jgi:hypothetical protein
MRKILLAVLLIAANGAPVAAACYDKLGCTDRKRFRTSDMRRMDCEKLWTMRNSILAENGYCFEDPRTAQAFGGTECKVKDITRLPLNPTERANFRTIAKVVTEKDC